jgi:hypothetical protein
MALIVPGGRRLWYVGYGGVNASEITVTPYSLPGKLIEKSAKVTPRGVFGTKRSVRSCGSDQKFVGSLVKLLTKRFDLAFDHGCEIGLVFILETCEEHKGRYTVSGYFKKITSCTNLKSCTHKASFR